MQNHYYTQKLRNNKVYVVLAVYNISVGLKGYLALLFFLFGTCITLSIAKFSKHALIFTAEQKQNQFTGVKRQIAQAS